jgi:hypothetical protein
MIMSISEKPERNAGVKENYRGGKVIVRLQQIYPADRREGTFFSPVIANIFKMEGSVV